MLRTTVGIWQTNSHASADVADLELIIAGCVARMVGTAPYRAEPTETVADGELDPDGVTELRRLSQQHSRAILDLDLSEREREAEAADLAALIAHAASRLLR
ncbi:hypothetical protein [Candidatus Poriferisodalis sp.]|uniref:hypothetical protein n=1 Tax=Candidatus Poriferisodalis sp. TaxID=3101277 RepID=UPI003B014EE9